jgi:tetratricopeptide (TPR) repeat protein
MPTRLLASLLFLSWFVLPAFSQGHGPGGGHGSSPSTGNSGNVGVPIGVPSVPSLAPAPPFLTGKVVLDDGSELTEQVAIQTICQGTRRTETYTDGHGTFSFQFGDPNNGAFNDASSSMGSNSNPRLNGRDPRDCEVQAVLAGFTSQTIELSSRMTSAENTDIGRLSLHRLEHVEGTSISVTSALAPSGAKKDLEKGRELEKKQQWDDAEKSFAKAVQSYPKYAVAWFELGKLQLHRKDSAAAKTSFQQAVASDGKYVDPYLGLAQIAMDSRVWKEVTETTDKLIALNPVNFPVAYYFNGVANFYLRDLNAAEKITRQGIAVDSGRQVPKLQFLLGVVLEERHEYQEAADHLQQYLNLPLNTFEAEQGRMELAKVARLSASATPATNVAK